MCPHSFTAALDQCPILSEKRSVIIKDMVAIELPLTPFFFEKLGIFQELTDKRLVRDKHLWGIEKSLLKWTLTGHQHLSTPITIDSAIHILTIVLKSQEVLKIDKKDTRHIIGIVLGNLCQRGYALPIERSMEEDQDYSKSVSPGLYNPGTLYREKINLPGIAIGAPGEVVFTQRGLLAGRVLVEIEEEHGVWKYKGLIYIVWFSLIVLFLITILIPFFKILGLCVYLPQKFLSC